MTQSKTKFEDLKQFALKRKKFRFGDINTYFGRPKGELNSYSTYLNYLTQSGFLAKKNGLYSVPNRGRLKYCTIADVKQYLFNRVHKRLLAEALDEAETWERVARMNKEYGEDKDRKVKGLELGLTAANSINAEHLQVQFQKDERITALENQVGFYQDLVQQYRAKIDGTLWRRFKRAIGL